MRRKILWADDEIELLKSHIIFLEKNGYDLTPVTNGEDVIELVKQDIYDAVLLDEMMPGLDGLSVLAKIKQHDPGLPVVMITKSHEEELMDDAIGSRISDYLTKPVNPSQIYTTLKRLLDSKQLRKERISREYARQAHQNRMELSMGLDSRGWAQIYTRLSAWDIELEGYNDPGLNLIHTDQKREFRREFCKYVEKHYLSWIQGDGPVQSHKILDTYVLSHLESGEKVYFIVIDCFRLDHWLAIEPKLQELFRVEQHYYYSLIPTATPFSRNALFAGLLPAEFVAIFPDIWETAKDEGTSMNYFEPELFKMYLARKGISFDTEPIYEKILSTEDARAFLKRFGNLKGNRIICMVYNFIDLLSHQMADNDILQEIAPDEAGFRSLAQSWFTHSVLLDILHAIADEGATVILTSDHGSITGERASIARGDRTTSTSVRYKYGRNLQCNPSEAFRIDDPAAYGLPTLGVGTNYLFAKEDYYLIYQNNFKKYEKMYYNSLQHGGISMEEMILPLGILRPR